MSRLENNLEVVHIRMVKDAPLYSDKVVETSRDAVEIVRKEMSELDREVFCIINLQTDGRAINMNVVSMGALNETYVAPREVFKSSILSNAAGIIAMHNHVSGRLVPSYHDLEATEKLLKAGEILGIPLLDHIIVSGRDENYLSMRSQGYFNKRTLAMEKKAMKQRER